MIKDQRPLLAVSSDIVWCPRFSTSQRITDKLRTGLSSVCHFINENKIITFDDPSAAQILVLKATQHLPIPSFFFHLWLNLLRMIVDESVPVGSGFTLAEFFNMFVGSGVVTEKKFSSSSVVWCLSCRSTHGRGAVGSRSLPHSQLTRQLQVLEDWSSGDFYCFRTLTGTEWQHAADHGQLWTEKGQDRDVPHESLSSSSLNSTHSPVVDRLHLNTLNVFCLALQGLELLELYLFIFFSFNFTLILIFSLIEIKISFRFFRSHKILTKKM